MMLCSTSDKCFLVGLDEMIEWSAEQEACFERSVVEHDERQDHEE